MSTREMAYKIIDNLSEEQLKAFVSLFEAAADIPPDIPNRETQAAMIEADKIANDPNVKGFTNIDDLMKELLS